MFPVVFLAMLVMLGHVPAAALIVFWSDLPLRVLMSCLFLISSTGFTFGCILTLSSLEMTEANCRVSVALSLMFIS